jgi:hypothetical protein
MRTCLNEDHDGYVIRKYLFNWLQLLEPVHGIRASSRAALSQKSGVRAQVTCDGPGAVLSQEVRVGAAGTRGGPRATLSREVRAGAAEISGSVGAALSREVGARPCMWGYPVLMVPTV